MAYIRVLFLSIFILFSAFNGYTFEADISQDLSEAERDKKWLNIAIRYL